MHLVLTSYSPSWPVHNLGNSSSCDMTSECNVDLIDVYWMAHFMVIVSNSIDL